MSVQLKIRSGRVLVDHDSVACPEIVRDATGTWLACAHDDHKVEGEKESERKARLIERAEQVEQDNPSLLTNTTQVDGGPKRASRPCACGCGEQTKVGRFLAGHDAKLKGRLMKMVREGDETERIVGASGLESRNWLHFLG